MKLSPQHCQQLAHVGVAGMIIVTGGVGLGAAAVCGSAAALGASGVFSLFNRWKTKDPTSAKALQRVADKIEADARWRHLFGDGAGDLDAIERACTLLGKFGARYWPEPGVVAREAAKEDGWPDAVARYVVDQIAASESEAAILADGNDAEARSIAIAGAAAALTAALDQESYVRKLQPHAMMETLGVVGEVRSLVSGLTEDFAVYTTASIALRADINGRLAEILAGLSVIRDDVSAAKAEIIAEIRAGFASVQGVTALAYDTASERYPDAPQISDELPTGPEPAEEFIREFVQLATSQNKREREAAALDAEGKTEDALALLEALAEEESAQAAERWKARGAMAFNAHTAKAIDSYERAIGCDPNDAEAHNQLGHLYQRIGEPNRAKFCYDRILGLGNQLTDKELLAIAFGNLGNLEKLLGNVDAADGYYQKSLVLDKELGRRRSLASTYGNLGLLESRRGNQTVAEKYYLQALNIEIELDNKEGMANQLGNLGNLNTTRGNRELAIGYYKNALELHEVIGWEEGIATTHLNLGVLELQSRNLDEAVEYFEKSLTLNETLGRKEGVALVHCNLGLLEKTRGNIDAACACWRKSYDLFAEIGMPHRVEQVLDLMREAGCSDAPAE